METEDLIVESFADKQKVALKLKFQLEWFSKSV